MTSGRQRYREKFGKEAFVSPPCAKAPARGELSILIAYLRGSRARGPTCETQYNDRVTCIDALTVERCPYMSRISQRQEDLFFAVGLMSLPDPCHAPTDLCQDQQHVVDTQPDLKGPSLPTRKSLPSALRRSHAVHLLIDSMGSKRSTSFSDPNSCVEALQTINNENSSHLLFLNGYSSPEWLTWLCATCETDPEFFNSNLIFRCRRTYFSYPSLASVYLNVVRLRVMTIGSRNPRGSKTDAQLVDQLRGDASTSMAIYHHELMLNSNVSCGDSIVRKYHVLDEKYFVIEQEIAVALQLREKMGWIDVGHSLAEGPRGPWLTDADLESPVDSPFFYPTFQHVENIALKSDIVDKMDSTQNDIKYPQTASLLPLDYGLLLETMAMAADPFYALTDLFRFAVASENQFLNLMEDYIGRETGHTILKVKQPTLSNLLYCQEILEDHTSRLKSTKLFVQRRGGSHWPRVPSSDAKLQAFTDIAAETLLSDFEQLEERSR
nr:hypothetical protein CFP56_75652 [Quercus suber]